MHDFWFWGEHHTQRYLGAAPRSVPKGLLLQLHVGQGTCNVRDRNQGSLRQSMCSSPLNYLLNHSLIYKISLAFFLFVVVIVEQRGEGRDVAYTHTYQVVVLIHYIVVLVKSAFTCQESNIWCSTCWWLCTFSFSAHIHNHGMLKITFFIIALEV